MTVCKHNQLLLESKLWFLPELLKQAGKITALGKTAAQFYVEYFKDSLEFSASTFTLLWNAVQHKKW